MQGNALRIYMHENRRHKGVLLYEWLLEQARAMGIHGGSAFRAIAGYGRHGVLHEQHFFELAGDVPVVVEFIVTQDEAARMLELLRRERVHAFYSQTSIDFGTLNGA
jgi:PII-like signaling protein